MSRDPNTFRALTTEEFRTLSPKEQANYLGQLAAQNLQENMAKYDPTYLPHKAPVAFDSSKARERGITAGILVVVALWGVIYTMYRYLARPLGEELASWISLAAGLFAGASMSPVQAKYAAWEARRFCQKNGHALKDQVAQDGRRFISCTRCYAVMLNEHASDEAHPNL